MHHAQTAAGVLYTVAWHAAGLRRTRQSASLDRAKEEATLKADQLAAGRIEAVMTTTAEDAALLAELRKVAGCVPLPAALREWAEASRICGGQLIPAARAWHEANVGSVKPVPVDVVVDEFLKAKRRAGKNTKASYESALGRMSEGLKGRPIASLSAKALNIAS